MVGWFASKQRGYFEYFYKADNGQWPLLRWACINVFLADEESIRIETNDREDVIFGAFEELRLWLEKRFKK